MTFNRVNIKNMYRNLPSKLIKFSSLTVQLKKMFTSNSNIYVHVVCTYIITGANVFISLLILFK